MKGKHIYRLCASIFALFFFLFPLISNAQNPKTLELFSTSGNPATNGPTVASQTLTLRENTDNPTGTTNVPFTANGSPVTVTYGLSNQQYNTADWPSNPGAINPGVFFGGTTGVGTDRYTASSLFVTQGGAGGSVNTNFTSSVLNAGGPGNGIDVATNNAIWIFNSSTVLRNAAKTVPGRYQMADLTITFSRPVTNPVLQFSGLGAFASSTNLTTEFDLITAGITLSKLSGSAELAVAGNQINNSAAIPGAVCGAGAACGSVLLTGKNISSVVLRVFLRGNGVGGTWAAPNSAAGDAFTVGVSVDSPVDLSINKTSSSLAPAIGSNINFTLTASNLGNNNATGVVVNDILPAGYTLVSATPSVGTYVPLTGVWTIGNLVANTGTATLTVVAKVNPSGPYGNTATITGNEDDPVVANNTSTVTPVPVLNTDRQITKTVNVATPLVGSNVIFTLNAVNNGPSSGTGITVTDVLPAGYTYVSNTLPTQGTFTTGTGVWTIGNLISGGTAGMTITASVNATGPYANTATISGTETDIVPGNNTSTVSTTPIPVADRAIAKTINNATPAVGSNVVFTLTATNNGPSASTGITVTDLLPSGYTYVSSTPPAGTTYNNVTGLWTIGTLANAATSTLTITAKVNANGAYGNTATITGTENDPTPGNNTSTSTPVPTPTTDRSVVKTVNNPTPAVGSNVVFTLVATNNGLSTGTGITVTDLLPAGYTYVSSTPPAGTTYNNATGLWTIGTLANAATSTLTITATVNATGPYANTATITGTENDPTPGNNTSTTTPTPTPTTDRSIVKTVNNGTPAVGSNVIFTLVATNNGPSAGTGITVTDLLPAGYTYVSSTPPAGTTYTPLTGLWTIGTLANAATSTLTITATVNATGPYGNTATITGTENDPTPGNNTSTTTPTPTPTTDRSVVKTVNNPTPAVGSNVIFTLAAINNGPSAGTGITVTDLLPAGYTYVSSTPPAGTTYNNVTGLWTIGTLANAATSTLTITAKVNATGPYGNTATITGTENDPTPGNNTSTSTPVPTPTTDRSVVKTVNNPTPAVGSNVIFTLVATNNGPSAGTGITVTDLLPAGYTYVSSAPPAGTTYNNVTGLWTIGTLANAATSTLTITATVNATGPYSNTATITGTENDPTPGNNTSTTTPTPTPTTDRSIVKTVNNGTPAVGSNVIFTLVATNNGPSAGTGITVTDLLPAGYTYVSSTPPAGTTYTPLTGLWTIGTLANAATSTLTITATVNATGPYSNTATITGTENDPTTGNNTSTITPLPTPTTDRSVVKTVNNSTPAVGSNVIFTLVATNNGPSTGTGIVVTDLLPAGYTYVSSTPPVGTTYTNVTGLWTIGTLSSAATSTLTITAKVNATGPYGNTATITGTENDPTPGNNTSTSTPVPTPTTDRSVVKTVNNSTPAVGSNVVFTLLATNNGPSAGTGITVTDLLPAGYTYVSSTPPVGTTYNNVTGLWTIGSLANTATSTLTITATVNATGPYGNTATITGTENDPIPGNNTSTTTPTPTPTTDRSVVKTVNNSTPAVGSNVVFTLLVTNNGPSAGTGIIVTDLLPAGYTYVSSTPPAGTTYNNVTGLWTIGTLANAATSTLTITATVNATGPYGNTATITGTENDPTPGNNTSTTTPTPTPTTDRSVVKTVNNATPAVGSNVVFTLVATNNGPSTGTGITVTDLLPAGYTYVSSNPSAGTTYTSGTGLWTIGTLTNGTSSTLTITATVNAAGPYGNTATITGTENDPTPGNNTSTSTPVPVPTTNLSILKTVDNPIPYVGNTVTFTLAAANAGPSNATGVVVNDLLPSGYTYISSVPSTGTYSSGSGIWTIGNLNNGANASLTITATVNATGAYSNSATISGGQNDPIPANNTSSVITTPINVQLLKTGPATAIAGTIVSYTITVSNTGNGNAFAQSISDNVSASLTSVSWTATPQGAASVTTGVTGSGNNVAVTGNIPAGGGNNILIKITGTIPASSVATSIANTATTTAPGSPLITSNTVNTTINKQADLQIQKVGPSNAVAGNSISYTLNVTNAGPSNASNVTITDNLPVGFNAATWTATPQNGAVINGPASGNGNVSISADIPTGTASVLVTITGVIDGSYAGATLVNTATATPAAGTTDPTPATSTVTTTIARQANVRITKSGPANIGAGQMLNYNLRIVNDGPSNVSGVVIQDFIPSQILTPTWTATVQNGATLSALSGSGNINLTGDIPAGVGIIDIVINGTVDPATVNATSFTNTSTANIPAGNPVTDPDLATNTSSVTTVVNNVAALRVSKSGPSTINIGDPITYTIVVTNGGAGNITGAMINDIVPSSVTVSTWSIAGTGGATVTGTTNGTTNTIATSGDIPAGANPLTALTITIQGIVNTGAAPVFTNTVNVTVGGVGSSSVTTAVNQSTDIVVEKSGTQTVKAGLPISYTIKLSNAGPNDAVGLVLNDIVPSQVQNITWSAVSNGASTITASLPGNTNTIQLTANITKGAANYILVTVNGTIDPATTLTSISNTAAVTLPVGLTDFNSANNSSTAVTAITTETNLTVVKTVSNTAPAVGSNVTFTLVASNAGPSNGTGIVVSDKLPTGYTYVSSTPPAGTSYTPATGAWAIGTLANGASATLTITATVNASGSYANLATITGTQTDPDLTNNTSSVTPSPVPTVDRSVLKTVNNATPAVGSNVVFTLVATNNGPSDGTGTKVTDLLPAGYTYVSSTPPAGTSYNAATGIWDIGPLANGTNSTLTITATVNATGPYANTATITGTENDPTTGNNTSTSTPGPTPTTDRSVVKTVDNANPAVGSNVVFTLVATNNGPSDGTGITVTDLLPTGYTYASSTPPAGTTYNNVTGLWTIGTLANAATSTLTITATVNASGPYANTASITGTENDPTPGNNTSTFTPAPVPTTDRSVVKTVDVANPAVGSNVVFTLVAKNNGPSDGTGILVTDLLPAGYTYISSTPPAGTTYSPATGLWTIGTLANAVSSTLTITAKVNATGPYNNTASISGTENDPTPGNNASTSTPIPTPTTDRSVVKTVSNTTPAVGSNVVFTLVAKNNGPSDGTGIIVTDLLPTGYTFVSSTPPAGTTYTPATGIWNIGILANGVNSTLTITATVNASGPYGNTASISGTENDPDLTNNTSTSTPIPVPTTDRSIVKTVDNATPAVGSNVIFTLVAKNNGPSDGTGITVTDQLPTGYTYISSTPPAGTTYTPATGIWNIGALTNGTNSTLTITAKVNAGGTYTNITSITGTENDPATGNDMSSTTPVPVPTTDRSLVKTVDVANPAVGSNVVFTLVAKNNGPSDGTGITVTDLLPAGYSYISSTPPVGTTYVSTSGLWTIGTLANAATSTLTITAKVNATGPYANTASITGTENDPTPGNNTSTSTPTPIATTDRSLVKTVDVANPAVGSNVVFTLVAKNNGPSDGTGITVTDLLPTGYTYISSTPPAGTTYTPATGIWNIGTMTNAATSTLTITAKVNATGPYANTASITGTENDPTPGNNTSTSTPTPVPTTDRSLVKTVDVANPAVGSNVVFTLVAKNNGPSDGTGITVTDLLPTGYTYISSTPPAGTTYTPATGVWNIGTITNAATSTLTITAKVNASGVYANTASITGTENDPTPGNNTSTSTPTPVPTTDRSLVKTVDVANPAVGSNVVFTLVAKNNGPSDGTGITVTDLLPTGYTYISSTPPAGTTYTPATGIWNIGAMTNAATSTLTITARVNATGPYANTASITGTENDPTPGNNTSTSTPTPVPTTDRSLVKTVDVANPAVGSNVVFTLVAKNNGPSDGTGITVTDLLPTGYTYISSTPPAGTTYTPATGVWNIGAMTNAATSTLTITAKVNASGVYANTASITGTENDPTPGNNTSTSTPTPVPTTDRSLVKTVDVANPAVGSNVVFTLVAKNNGPSDGTGITVTDLLPAGYSYISSTPPVGTTYVSTSGLWAIGTLANAATSTLTITAKVNATGPYANTASITGTENDPTPGNNTSTSTPTPVPTTDRSLVKTVDVANPAVGSNVVFTLVAKNNGPSDGTGITVTDLLPTGYTYISSTPPAGTTYTPATGIWNIGTMTNAATSTLTITAKVNATGPYANTASITGTENDPTPGNNTSTSTPTPVPTTDRSLVKTVDVANPAVGSNVVFTLVAKNNGPSDGTGITVTDLLPAGYSYISSTPPVGTTYTPATGIWDIGTMTNAATSTLTITAKVNATGPYANTASITGTENDPTPGNNTSTSTPTPVPTTDISLVKTVDVANPAVGSNVVFTLVAKNNGPSDGTGITVTDLLPTGYTYISSTPPAGTTYTPATGIWDIGAMTNVATSTLTITAKVNATGPYANTASITGTENDPTPGNNTSTSTPTPVPTTDRSLVKTVDVANPAVGSNVVFTLVATNNGPSDGTGITVTDLLPTGYTYISSTPPAGTTYTPATGIWNIGTMTNAATSTLTITAKVNASGVYANTASITGTENDPTPGNNNSTSTPTPVPTTDRSLVKTVDNANPAVGSNVVFTLVATNNGPSDGTGITVTDLLPTGYTYISSTPPAGTTYTPATGVWNIGTMTNAATSTLTITAKVNASGVYANTASITGTENDPTTGNNTSTSTPVPVLTTNLSVLKTVDNPTPAVGSNVVFTLVASNSGPSNGTGITVTDLLPAGYTYISSTPPTGTTYNNTTGLWTIGALTNGANATLTITATVKATGPYANTASIKGNENDPTPNNTSTSTPIPVATTDMTLVKTVNNTSPSVGSNVIFTLVATNNGPSAGTGITVTDLLPAGYTYMSVITPVGTTYAPATGLWNIGTLANSASVSLAITAKVNPTGPYSNTASITGNENDPTPGNNTSTSTPIPVLRPGIALTKKGPATISSGATITYVIEATNNGPSDAMNLGITDPVDAQISNVKWTAVTSGSATVNSGANGTGNAVLVSGNITASSGDKITITITGTVSPSFAGKISNIATATPSEPGSIPIITPPAETMVSRIPGLAIAKTGPANLKSGDLITYTVELSNTSLSDAKNLTLTDFVPNDIQNVEWTAAVTGTANILSATSGKGNNISLSADLPSGTANKVNITIKGSVSRTFTGNLINTAKAQSSEAGAPEVSSNTVQTIVDNADFIIPNIITPNGDGNNDTFKIKGLENYPGTDVSIFNRWGNEVYRSSGYKNDWDGSQLNEGTYYYLIIRKEKSGSTTAFKGWLFIRR
ncbi:DUF11 domain-containing protein [Pedobacter sp. PAMC26386]|nr:DUF11 domain-containing protein [Pedobacter sp. PAMC26386]